MKNATRLAVAALLLAAVSSCRKGGEGPRTRPPPAVTVAAVRTTEVPVEIRSPVDLRPIEQADVGAKTLGYLDAVLVDRGDRVRRGQLLAVVRPSDLPDQLAAARGALAQAQATAVLARSDKERTDRLAPTGYVTQAEQDRAQSTLATSEATLAAARANVDALATRLGETRIESPLTGVVSVRRLDPGALVGPNGGGGNILTVQRLDVLRVFVPVNERDAARLRVGQDARVELDALPGKPIAGKVVRVSPSFDPVARTLDAEVQVRNPGALRPGMYGRAAIVTEIHRDAVVVPAAAVQITNDRSYVFVLAGENKVKRVRIETGVDGGDWLEVTKGLARGDEIVTAGMDVLSDGATVRPQRNVDAFAGPGVASSAPSK